MARQTKAKKNAQMPQVERGAEIFASLRELEKIKGIPVEYMVERLKQALTNAYRKDREDNRDIPAENVVVDLSEKGLSMHLVKTAVEEVEDPTTTIHIDAAGHIHTFPGIRQRVANTVSVNTHDLTSSVSVTWKVRSSVGNVPTAHAVATPLSFSMWIAVPSSHNFWICSVVA